MRVRAAVLSVVPAVVMGLVVAPSAIASSRPTPPTPGTRVPAAARAHVPAIAAAAVSELRPGTTRLVVRTRSASTARSLHANVTSVGTVTGLSASLARIGYLSVTVPTAKAAAARASLAAMPGVVSVREAAMRTPDLAPDDPQWAASPDPQSTMYGAVQAPAAWDSSQGEGVTIAVLDGGFDATHPDLAGKVAGTWDVVWDETGVADASDDPYSGHGTATASTAGAATGNGIGIAGAAPKASLLLVQVGDDTQRDEISEDASAAGIIWAADNGADVISMSYGSTTASAVEADAIAYALGKGVVIVASAGNDGLSTAHYPASVGGVIAVGATDHTGTAATSWSSRGSWVDVAAPGAGVRVAAPVGSFIDTAGGGATDGYAVVDGTSFSGPMVAGFAAILLGEHPGTTPADITTAITSGTKAISPAGVFAHGLVQVTNALASFADDTVLTAPSAGEYSGTVTVTATSSAPTVRFSVDGTTTAVSAAVTSGTASAELPLYGLVSAKTIRAAGCYGTSCAAGTSTVGITVTSAAPVLTAPADGALAELSFDAAATADGGSVRFLVDGVTSIGLDTEAPYALTIDTAGIANGAHTVTAVGCNADGTTCETDPSNSAAITVRRLRPTVSVSPSLFSPNGDGRKDTATVGYKLEQAQTVVLRVYNGSGAVVRGPLTLGTAKPAGSYTYVWNGKSNSGALVPDGSYRLEISTSQTISGTPWIGRASTTVRSDRTKPSLASTSASPSTFYPYVDGYRDTTSLRSKSNEAVAAVTITVYNSSGTKVRTLTATSRPVGWLALTWNGKSSSGKLLPAGTYRFTVMAQDAAGNRATTAKYSVALSSKKLVRKTGTKTIAPYNYVYQWYAAECSRLYYDVRSGSWPASSMGFFSDYLDPSYECTGDGNGDVALGWYRWSLPSAIKYGSVAVAAYGGSFPGYSDVAQLTYVRSDGRTAGYARTLYGTDGTYKGSSVPASSYLYGGRALQWVVASAYGNWYEVRNFTVTWTYYVLG